MKKRTFFVVLILFLVFLNSLIMVLSLVMLKDQLSALREKALAEHYVIASSLIGDMQALEQRGGKPEKSMDRLMRSYARYLQSGRGGLAVSFDGEWIYNSCQIMPAQDPRLLTDPAGSSERVIIMENKTDPILCIYGRFPAPWQDWGLMYVGDLSMSLSSWRHTRNILFLTGAGVMLALALFLFEFLNIIFRPLRQISTASARIANGDYGRRIPVQGKDEIAAVANHFNLMASQVQAHIRKLQDSADQKQQFIDNFAHELRIPLTAIYGYAEYIQRAALPQEERYECTQFIMSECRRLQNLAYQLLDLASLREIVMEDCPLEELFTQCRKIMQPRADRKGVGISFSAQDEDGHMHIVRGNREQLLCLVNNLIDNGLKASPPESRVSVRAFSEDGHVTLEVADQGIGMRREELARIKEAFYRVDKARSRADGGAGLGLSICERIALLHRAELSFDSEPGKGTRARISFPRGSEDRCFTDSQ